MFEAVAEGWTRGRSGITVPGMSARPTIDADQTRKFLRTLFEDDVHARRVWSLSGATLGVIHSASLAVTRSGRGWRR